MDVEQKETTKKLSKGVLELKFMKKSKEKAELQEENEERQQLYQDQLSLLHKGADRIVMIDSYFDCMDFLPCRLSFGGMDPDIEKLNEDKLTGVYKTKPILPISSNGGGIQEDVTAEEIAENYSKLLGNKAKQFTKRKSDQNEYDNTEDSPQNKFFKGNAARGKRPMFNNREYLDSQGSEAGKGDFSNRGRGDFGNRGRGDFGNRGRGDFGNRGRGDFGNRGRGDFGNRGRGDFGNRGRGDFGNRGRGDFGNRGRGDFRGRGRGDFSNRGNVSHDDMRGEGDQTSGRNFSPGLKKLKFMNPQE
ncbi:N66 matrix protein-like [Penaeus japonicus]|uniref:N66 matrix protein-like n=1 Tax=Penaeus japonicus TaxID=27405 RepID=UPI001C71557E|nr:N66 matrix protein-like [Penaeus japonicus]